MTLRIFLLKCPSSVFTVKCFGASIGGKPLANPAKLCASGLFFFQLQPVTQSFNQPASQPTGPECPGCHLRIMGKECSQLFSVLIISDVEEMEGLWVNASPAELSPGERRGEEAGQEGAEQREKRGG